MKTRGRPKKNQKALSSTEIIISALLFIETEGNEGLSMRALANELDITPMSIYHHVGTRIDLLNAMVKKVYEHISSHNIQLKPKEVIQTLLSNYCEKSLSHPRLSLCLISSTELSVPELDILTETIQNSLISIGLTSEQSNAYLDILIDYTHGFVMAAAQQYQSASEEIINKRLNISTYRNAIQLILGAINVNYITEEE